MKHPSAVRRSVSLLVVMHLVALGMAPVMATAAPMQPADAESLGVTSPAAPLDGAIAVQLIRTLDASDGAAGDQFGFAAAIFGNTAVIGARWDDDKGLGSGSAYVFWRAHTNWEPQQQKLTANDGAAGDEFG